MNTQTTKNTKAKDPKNKGTGFARQGKGDRANDEQEAVKKITKLCHLGESDVSKTYRAMLDSISKQKIEEDLVKEAHRWYPDKQARRAFLRRVRGLDEE